MGKYFRVKYSDMGGMVDFLKPNKASKLGDCVKCGKFTDYDPHEKITRARGGQRKDAVKLCRVCHTWVTNHPRAAAKIGLYEHGYEINKE